MFLSFPKFVVSLLFFLCYCLLFVFCSFVLLSCSLVVLAFMYVVFFVASFICLSYVVLIGFALKCVFPCSSAFLSV